MSKRVGRSVKVLQQLQLPVSKEASTREMREYDAHLLGQVLDTTGDPSLAVRLFELVLLVEHVLVDLKVGDV